MKAFGRTRFRFPGGHGAGRRYPDRRRSIACFSAIALVAVADCEGEVRAAATLDPPGPLKHHRPALRLSLKNTLSMPAAIPPGLPKQSESRATEPSPPSLSDLDKIYGVKGWDISFPSFSDTLTQDFGGWRSTMASAGFGVMEYNITRFQSNMLDTPRQGPTFNRFYGSSQTYWGQQPSFSNMSILNLTYDLGRFGIPDGQLQLAGVNAYATWQSFIPDASAVSVLAYYQTLFDRRFEVKFGILPNQGEFVGQSVGGAFATTQGPSGSIISQLGMPALPVATPSFRVTGHLTDTVYNEAAVIRSLVVNGVTGNTFFDTIALNPSNLRWNVNTSSYSPTAEIGAPGTRALFVDEIGYKREATPTLLYSWVRFGAMYNDSTFHDYSKSVAAGGLVRGPIGPTIDGDSGFYFLADQQITQFTPDSPSSASRGIYIGGTAMYAPPQTTAVTQYYEGRLYSKGPFDSRPTDLVSLVVYRQVNSPYLVANLDTMNAQGTYGARDSWSATVSYLAHLMPGVHLGFGLNYTTHPSGASFFGPSKANPFQRFQGDSLNFQINLFTLL